MKKKEYEFLKETKGRFIIAMITSTILSVSYLGFAYFMQVLINAGNVGDKKKIFSLTWMCFLYTVIYFFIGHAQVRTMNAYSNKMIKAYKKDRLKRIIQMPFSDFSKKDVGTYISSLTNNSNVIYEGFGKGIVTILRLSLQIILVILYMIYLNWQLFIITGIVFIFPLFVTVSANNKIVSLNSIISKKNSSFISGIKDFLGGYGIIKSFRAEEEVLKPIGEKIDDLEVYNEKLGNKTESLEINSNTSIYMGMMLLFIVGSLQVIKGGTTIGDLIAYLQLIMFIQYPIDVIPGQVSKLTSANKLVKEDFIEDIEVPESSLNIDTINDKIEIKDLKFSYDNEKFILNGIDMQMDKGGLYAIVGASGSGKSTLVNLLRGYYDNYDGSINFDGNNLRKIANLYDIFTVIDQNVFIFNSTISDNICMYKEFPEEEIKKAVKLAGLSKLVEEKGLDYQCGENGINLSGGERQRISIARALISRKQFIAMDESTSSLDIVTAKEIEHTIDSLDGVLRLVITHNLNENFLKNCDKIFVVKNGKIVESGAFDELIERRKLFYSMLELWQ